MTNVIDQDVRYALLNPGQSFIVQAPAGSGKTELLTQRILALLNVVEKPESILAITFTKKAAAEMRERVLSALVLGQQPEPEAAHEKYRWKLAQKVLQRDKEKSWNLVANPARLNITTIDSLSSSLSAALPLLSQTGAMPKIEEDASPYYRKAIESLMSEISEGDKVAINLKLLLQHKDNNLPLITNLLSQMLAKRLQWFAPLQAHAREFNRESLNEALANVTENSLRSLYSNLSQDVISELPRILNFCREQLARFDKVKALKIAALSEVEAIGAPNHSDIKLWQAIAELFLTDKGEPRKALQHGHGFPAKSKAKDSQEKALFEQVKKDALALIKTIESKSEVVEDLNQIRLLPADIDKATNQHSLRAVIELLPQAAAHLKLIFSQYNVIDFPELSLAAIDALGHEDLPSDLALALDYKLEHILIDEFQDTSSPQIQLIESLITGWEPNQGKTLFFVGDPMQSIYRFRDANVSLFMQIREQGVADIPLEFKKLSVNFRSSEVIVNWVNNQFSQIMPAADDLTLSAVSYSSSVAFNSPTKADKVECRLFVRESNDINNGKEEAEDVIRLVKKHLKDNIDTGNSNTLAILARSRSHLKEIVAALNRHNLSFEAVELDALSEKMIVKDLVNLVFALTDDYDELSWASIMRAPWFGLSLQEIKVVLTQSNLNGSVIERIEEMLPKLSVESNQRVTKILPLLKDAIAHKGLKPFKKWIAGCFEAVGGFHQVDYASEIEDFKACLNKLAEINEGGEFNDRKAVKASIAKLYASPNPKADKQVQLMTIHKSKGLEFNTVILPGLDRTPPPGDTPLLNWTEVIDEQGNANQLLAISKEAGKESDEVYRYISYLDRRKSEYESQRVLYVAATRAKDKLYLLGSVVADEKFDRGVKRAALRSYLGLMWEQVIGDAKLIKTTGISAQASSDSLYRSRYVKRTNITAIQAKPSESQTVHSLDLPLSQSLEFSMDKTAYHFLENSNDSNVYGEDWATATGNVIHRYLEWISYRWVPHFEMPANWLEMAKGQLINEGIVLDKLLQAAIERVQAAVCNTLESDFGKFILKNRDSASSELTMQKKLEEGHFLTRVIDRTFIDEGVRWIVDYKSSKPEDKESLAEFLGREKALYETQITDYFNMFKQLEKCSIKAGLYFPLIDHFELMLEHQ